MVSKWFPLQTNAKFRRECKYKASIQAKDAKIQVGHSGERRKDKGFGRTEGKKYNIQAMQIQLQAPIQAIQHQASPGERSITGGFYSSDPGCA